MDRPGERKVGHTVDTADTGVTGDERADAMGPGAMTTSSPMVVEARIRILDEDVANKIAAGEVVERPASVVKELVENSVDAGATRITVELEDGGRRLIRVTDNGGGMTAQEAVLALQRHATSKITRADDLASIRTLGFRGEALPSIASVSRLTFITRARGELAAAKLEVEGGEIRSLSEVGAPEGTSITVTDLFYNVPARLKFLKSARTELGQACDWLTRIALAHGTLALRLLHEGGELLHSPGSPDLVNVVAALYGKEVARELLPAFWERGGLRVQGLVSRPTFTRPTRSGQSFFVNGRYVRSRSLTHALDEAYRSTMHAGRYPFAVLAIDLDPSLVDVNVHPTKAEVRFLREWELHRAAHEAVRQAIGLEAVPRGGAEPLAVTITQAQLAEAPWTPRAFAGPTDTGTAGPAVGPATHDPDDPFAVLDPGSVPAIEAQTTFPQLRPSLHELRPICQLWQSYILAETTTGLLIVDQHLAHERVLFDRLTQAGTASPVAQQLAIPVTLSVSHRQALLVDERLEQLRRLGFDVEPFGRDAFVVRAVPHFVRAGSEARLVQELFDGLAEGSLPSHLPGDRLQATTACKAAVKKGDRLQPEEMQKLLDDWRATTQPHTCPHGCPIAIEVTYHELLRRFKRV
jgi:DNA mismatch repair protein MutL